MSTRPTERPVVVFCHPIAFGNPTAFDVRTDTSSYVTEKIDVNDDELPSWEDQLESARQNEEVKFFFSKDFNKSWAEHALKHRYGVMIISTDIAGDLISDQHRQEVRAYYRACKDFQSHYKFRSKVSLVEMELKNAQTLEKDYMTVERLLLLSSVL